MIRSETLFEEYCRGVDILAEKIPTRPTQTPDYILAFGQYRLLSEVKEIEQNSYEKALFALPFEQWGENECVYYGGAPGARLRKKIAAASRQLKAYDEQELPTLLVIWNSIRPYPDICDDSAISTAMFGIETALISSQAAPEGGATILKRWHGGDRQCTPRCNTSLSAVGILDTDKDLTNLRIYHNPFARVSLSPVQFSPPRCTHKQVASDPQKSFVAWNNIVP